MKKGYEYIESLDRGMYFEKQEYKDTELYKFEDIKDKLPQPILLGKDTYLNCYWYAMEIAFKNVHKPTKQSGFVSNFVDAAFNDNIFLWDTVFITMFCNVMHPYIPGIRSLDNFYCKQFEDGEIPREIIRDTGKDMPFWTNSERYPLYSYFHKNYGHRKLMRGDGSGYGKEDFYFPELNRKPEKIPYLTLDNLNHPILAWAELESYKYTGDNKRIKSVFKSLLKYYEALKNHIKKDNNLYVTDWASMDNSPRNRFLGSGIDISCEIVLFANNLLEIIEIIKEKCENTELELEFFRDIKKVLENDNKATAKVINDLMWDNEEKFYYDVTSDNKRTNIKTIAAFWSIISNVADEEKVAHLVNWINDKDTFNRVHRVPVCSADVDGYNSRGGYWRGSVWAPTNTMVIRGLENRGYKDLARDIALNHLDNVVKIFDDTGTIWENYPPDAVDAGDADKKDFVGWSGIAPILYLIEHKIGIRADATNNKLIWNINEEEKQSGCLQYWFNDNTIDLKCKIIDNKAYVNIKCNKEINLIINCFEKMETFSVFGNFETVIER